MLLINWPWNPWPDLAQAVVVPADLAHIGDLVYRRRPSFPVTHQNISNGHFKTWQKPGTKTLSLRFLAHDVASARTETPWIFSKHSRSQLCGSLDALMRVSTLWFCDLPTQICCCSCWWWPARPRWERTETPWNPEALFLLRPIRKVKTTVVILSWIVVGVGRSGGEKFGRGAKIW